LKTDEAGAAALICEAERQINCVLEQLERDTGQMVEALSLRDVDITTIADDGTQLLRSAAVVLKRLPGSRWMSDMRVLVNKAGR
jgi:hypothetical protein